MRIPKSQNQNPKAQIRLARIVCVEVCPTNMAPNIW